MVLYTVANGQKSCEPKCQPKLEKFINFKLNPLECSELSFWSLTTTKTRFGKNHAECRAMTDEIVI